MTRSVVVAGKRFVLEREQVEAAVDSVLPEPIREHFVVVGGRRFPPKQVLRAVTGLDRADFTTHHARRILRGLGFVAGRRPQSEESEPPSEGAGRAPYGGRQAEVLRPYVGRWVALGGPLEVLVAADSPAQVLAWLAQHGRTAAGGMFRVPTSEDEAGGAAPL